MSKDGYACPACEKKFLNTDNGACPHCGAKLLSMSRRRGHAFEYYYVLDAPLKTAAPATAEVDEGRLVSVPGEDPEIWEVVEDKHYRVVYKSMEIMAAPWFVHCPFCRKKLFQNQILSGLTVQEHKCKCGIFLQFFFQMPIGPFRPKLT